MSAKRSRIGRSSSTSGFNDYQRYRSVKPPQVASKPRPFPATNPVKKPVQKQAKSVVPLNPVKAPRRCIFAIGVPLEDCRERDDDVKGVFWANCSHCKREIVKDGMYMYGYLQAFCSPECREKRIEIDEKTRKPSPQVKRYITNRGANPIVSQVKKKCTVP